MKRAGLIVGCLLMLLFLFGCTSEELEDMNTKNNKTVTFINEVNEADVWILPKTEENLKTTVWGKATISKIKKNESRKAVLCEAGDNGLYIFRMIDTDSFYYSANDITLKADWSLKIKEKDLNSFVLEVTDENGDLKNTYEVFSARL